MINKLSQYRREIMGTAIILIMLCHSTLYFNSLMLRHMYYTFISFCKVGVDIFFMMSGMGLYFSFCTDSCVCRFLKKRINRLLPTYIFVIFCWGVFSIAISLEDASSFLWKYSLVSFFINAEMAAWFVAAILLLYAVFPLIYRLNVRRHVYIYVLSMLIWIFSLAITLLLDEESVLRRINETFIVRTPTFLLGISIGKAIKEKQTISCSKTLIACISVITMGLYVVNMACNVVCERWVERVLFMPASFCIAYWIAMILSKISQENVLAVLLNFLGGITFEVYLLHEKVLLVYDTYIPKCMIGSFLANVSAYIVSVLIGGFVSKVIIRISNKQFFCCKRYRT